jgi:hypothetical protein
MHRLTDWARGSTARQFLVAVSVMALAGVVLGVLWWLTAPTMPGLSVNGGIRPIDDQPGEFIEADGLFAVGTFVFGLLASWWVRRWWTASDGLAMAALVLGLLAASTIAALVGSALGPSYPADDLVDVMVEAPLRLQAAGWLLIGPIAGVGLWFARDFGVAWKEAGTGAEGDDASEGEPDDGLDGDSGAEGRQARGLGREPSP